MSVDGKIFKAPFKQDYRYSGSGSIDSTTVNAQTQVEGVPQQLRVFVLDSATFEIAYVLASDSGGDWSIPNVTTTVKFVAIAQDPDGLLNSAIVDNIFAT